MNTEMEYDHDYDLSLLIFTLAGTVLGEKNHNPDSKNNTS
jgi:hypothetical protein